MFVADVSPVPLESHRDGMSAASEYTVPMGLSGQGIRILQICRSYGAETDMPFKNFSIY